MRLSSCGLDCDGCGIGQEKNCPGCHACEGNPFWSDGTCDLYACATERRLENCAACENFPCDMLQEWATGEGPERVENLRALREAN